MIVSRHLGREGWTGRSRTERLNKLPLSPEEHDAKYGEMLPAGLDRIDRKIAALLSENGRRSYASIARQLGMSQSAVKKRVDGLLARRVIRVTGTVNPTAAGYTGRALVSLKLAPEREQNVMQLVEGWRDVLWAVATAGRFDIVLEVTVKSPADLMTFLIERIGSVEGIQAYETLYIMDEIKYGAMFFGNEDEEDV